MKTLYITFILCIIAVNSFTEYPVTGPIIGEKLYGSYKTETARGIVLSNNRIMDAETVVCADSANVYIEYRYKEDRWLLSISKDQIVSISPPLPAEVYLGGFYSEDYFQNEFSLERIRYLKPTHKYIVQSFIEEIDSYWGITVYSRIHNLTKNRIKYVLFPFRYYNRVGDIIHDEITKNSTHRCRLTGFIDPGKAENGRWEKFYGPGANFLKLSSFTLTFANGNQATVQLDGNNVLQFEN